MTIFMMKMTKHYRIEPSDFPNKHVQDEAVLRLSMLLVMMI